MRIDIPFKFRPFNLQMELGQTGFLFHEIDFPYLMEACNNFFFFGLYSIFWNQNFGWKTNYDFLDTIPCFQYWCIHVETYHQSFFIGFQATAATMLIISKFSQTLWLTAKLKRFELLNLHNVCTTFEKNLYGLISLVHSLIPAIYQEK